MILSPKVLLQEILNGLSILIIIFLLIFVIRIIDWLSGNKISKTLIKRDPDHNF